MRDPQLLESEPHNQPEHESVAGQVTPFRTRPKKSGKKMSQSVMGHAATTDQDKPKVSRDVPREQLRREAGLLYNVLSKISLRTAPFSSWLYDCQMNFGKGVRTVSHRMPLRNFPSTAPPLKVAFLSDLHYGPTSGRLAMRQAWKLARDSKPDVVLLGGDYLFADERGLPAFLRELQRWQFSPPPGGIYACLGNHDYYAGYETMVTCLEACGVRVLVNDAAPLPSPWKGVWIGGVDDLWHGEPDLEATLDKTTSEACTILLAHEPDICAESGLSRVAITLSGHTHGGQICMPNGDPIYVPSKHGREYSAGLHRHAGQWLFVSKGVGTVGLPIRMFCPPDVALFEFFGRSNRAGR